MGIGITKRRLNPRYYAGSSEAQINCKFKYSIEYSKKADESAIPTIIKWVMQVKNAAKAFEKLRCQGVIKATVINNIVGYGTEGNLSVFDEQTQEAMSPAVTELFRALNGKPSEAKLYKICFIITLKMKKIYLHAEGKEVSFEELDTEAHRMPKHSKVVTVHSPMLN
jgi:hypothetical protein